jgi:hypothetical protein
MLFKLEDAGLLTCACFFDDSAFGFSSAVAMGTKDTRKKITTSVTLKNILLGMISPC